ncbi:hypothetical protein B5X24_HaOG208795 [Helicoverpa armigera]|uniref:Uncharacterized protein n=1 Tax=Helicoverpa armigera TaxID=29058 RepID=A0A2W1BJE0_HELAM|nr:hypothetical protein B5X24_HaOG208795 [Helicoverpa armigera]
MEMEGVKFITFIVVTILPGSQKINRRSQIFKKRKQILTASKSEPVTYDNCKISLSRVNVDELNCVQDLRIGSRIYMRRDDYSSFGL